MKRHLLILSSFLLCFSFLQGKVQFPTMLEKHMIPQNNGRNKRHILWYDTPAPNGGPKNVEMHGGFPYDSDWEQWSLPIGNGYMGANIFGRTDTERIQLTEKTLGVKGAYGSGGIANFAEIYLDIYHQTPVGYRRELCLDNAVCTVSYRYDSVKYTREYFANYPSNVIVVKLKADVPGKVSFLLRPVLPYLHEYNKEKTGRTGQVFAQDDLIIMSGESQFFKQSYEGQIKVLRYGGSAHAINDANQDHGMIQINNADSVCLLITAKTSYELTESVFSLAPERKFAGNKHPHEAVSRCIVEAEGKGVSVLQTEHINDYQSLYSRVGLSLTDSMLGIPTDKLLQEYKQGKEHRYLEELVFQYGRYLLIASSRKGALPAHLQGAWSQFDFAPWTGGYWHNINVQMNYWPAFNTNLAELFEPYVDFNEAFRKKANEAAISYIRQNNPEVLAPTPEENGWTIGTGANAFSISAPGGHSGPGTGGFTTKLFWDYYDFTRDESLLSKHAYPAIKGMAKFLSKTLKPAEDGVLLAVPSSSPEQYHKGAYYQTKGCTFDQSMIQENFKDLLNAATVLKDKDPFLKTVKEQIKKLDAIHVGESGQIKEYREEKKYSDIGDPHHRHISHLCALYPGTTINSHTPKWMKASIVTLNGRGDFSTGWAMAHRLCSWARLKDGDRSHKIYSEMLRTKMFENLWFTHPPFQVDANFGATAGVAEMLLQSHEGYMEPLPALPEAWANGFFKGLVARGNFVVSVEWKYGKITQLDILSRRGVECACKYEDIGRATVLDSKGRKVKVKKEEDNLIRFSTNRGENYKIVF